MRNIAMVTMPDMGNHMGIVHGGEIMKILDNAAGLEGVFHTGGNVVTAHAEVDFLSKVKIGEYINTVSEVVFTGHMSLIVYTALYAESFSGEKRKAAEGYFMMVPINDAGKPYATKKMEKKISPEAKKAEDMYKRIV